MPMPPRMTAQDLYQTVVHALGRIPRQGNDVWHAINQAGRALMRAHPWNWREVGPVEIPVVEGVDHVVLPDDFDTLTSASIPGNTLADVSITTFGEIIRLRRAVATLQGASSRLWMAFPLYEDDENLTKDGRWIAAIYPTPLTTGEPTIAVTYRKRWRDLWSDDPKALPNIPRNAERALVLLARAYAIHLEDQQQALEDAAYVAELETLKTHDGMIVENYGPMSGGAGRFRSMIPDPYIGRVEH